MMPENEVNKGPKAQLLGWVLFVICGVLFALAGVKAHDIVTIAASITFLLGCVVFMALLVKGITHDDRSG